MTRLDPARHALYLALRDSDAEQALGDFAGALTQQARRSMPGNVASCFFAKLRHKQQYALLCSNKAVSSARACRIEDRSYAHSLLTQSAAATIAMPISMKCASHLESEQFRLLSDFERTEFDLELRRWQQSINER